MQHQAMDFKTILHAAHYAVLVVFLQCFWQVINSDTAWQGLSDIRHSKTHRVNPMVHKNTMAGWEVLRRRTCFFMFRGWCGRGSMMIKKNEMNSFWFKIWSCWNVTMTMILLLLVLLFFVASIVVNGDGQLWRLPKMGVPQTRRIFHYICIHIYI